jgi:hypothetical protein
MEPNEEIYSSDISVWPMDTCRSCHCIESPGDDGVGNTLTSVAVGSGNSVTVTGVADGLVDEHAVKINSPIKLFIRLYGIFFI